jgi:hypothetical protein
MYLSSPGGIATETQSFLPSCCWLPSYSARSQPYGGDAGDTRRLPPRASQAGRDPIEIKSNMETNETAARVDGDWSGFDLGHMSIDNFAPSRMPRHGLEPERHPREPTRPRSPFGARRAPSWAAHFQTRK